MAATTTIQVTTETRDRLRSMFPDESFDRAVNAAIDLAEDHAFWLELETDRTRMAAAVAALPSDEQAAWAQETAALDADMASLSSAL